MLGYLTISPKKRNNNFFKNLRVIKDNERSTFSKALAGLFYSGTISCKQITHFSPDVFKISLFLCIIPACAKIFFFVC